MKHETAGDPVSGLKWTRKTTKKIADELEVLDIKISPNINGTGTLQVLHNLK